MNGGQCQASFPVNVSMFLLVSDKTAAVGEPTDMTDEEWNLRVAELNKHQVTSAKKTA